MTHQRFLTLMSFAICATMLCAVVGIAGEKKITKKELPGEVLSAFQKAYPKATIKGLSKEEENGKTYYEIESLDGKTARDISYLADGKVAEIEEAVATSALPAAVKATVGKEYPKGKIVKSEKTTRESTVEYEIHVTVGKDKHELVVDPSGKVVKHEKEGKEEDEKEDMKK
jgi:hypothetical protein